MFVSELILLILLSLEEMEKWGVDKLTVTVQQSTMK